MWRTVSMLGIAAVLALILPELPDSSLFVLNERLGMFQPLEPLAAVKDWENLN